MENKETIEEAAKRLCNFSLSERVGFYKCFDWQQERSYSEEDMKQFAYNCVAGFLSNEESKLEMELVGIIMDRNNKKFEQFKNK